MNPSFLVIITLFDVYSLILSYKTSSYRDHVT